ncbi:MAG: PorP/SprF family type IX secretion system membrane protein [Chitinophagales bacterium]|jgi:type IX secretion system PorP/SprF family membrane protein|nr:PorP/SprF family type IX secretion system membrane protein [Chitinophagales bacterium]
MTRILTLWFFFSTKIFLGQDAHFSQALNFPLLLNPALQGSYDGLTRVTLAARNQQFSIPNSAFKGVYQSFAASLEHRIFPELLQNNQLHLGLYAKSDIGGASSMTMQDIVLSSSYAQSLDPYHAAYLRFGFQIGLKSRRSFINDLLFETQVEGFGFNPSIPNLENLPDGLSGLSVSMNLGTVFTHQVSDNFGYIAGFSLYHFNNPTDIFNRIDAQNSLPQRLNLVLGAQIQLDELRKINPSAIYMLQGQAKMLNIGFNFQNEIQEDLHLLLGLRYRVNDAFIPSAGIQFNNMKAQLSYDLSSSALSRFNGSFGALELTLNWLFGEVDQFYKPSSTLCPHF